MKTNKKISDFLFLMMIIVSFFISIVVSSYILDSVQQDSQRRLLLTKIVYYVSHLKGSVGTVYWSNEIDLIKGAFFLPFFLLLAISFLIYRFALKGEYRRNSPGDDKLVALFFAALVALIAFVFFHNAPLIFILILLGLVALTIYLFQFSVESREASTVRAAKELGFSMASGSSSWLMEHDFREFSIFKSGTSNSLRNIMKGQYEGKDTFLMDYHCTQGYGGYMLTVAAFQFSNDQFLQNKQIPNNWCFEAHEPWVVVFKKHSILTAENRVKPKELRTFLSDAYRIANSVSQ